MTVARALAGSYTSEPRAAREGLNWFSKTKRGPLGVCLVREIKVCHLATHFNYKGLEILITVLNVYRWLGVD